MVLSIKILWRHSCNNCILPQFAVPLRQDFINVLTRSRHAHVGSSTRETNCNKILPSPTFVVRISTRHSLSPKSTTRKTRKENSMFGNKTCVTPPGRRKQYTPKNTSNQIKVVSEPKNWHTTDCISLSDLIWPIKHSQYARKYLSTTLTSFLQVLQLPFTKPWII